MKHNIKFLVFALGIVVLVVLGFLHSGWILPGGFVLAEPTKQEPKQVPTLYDIPVSGCLLDLRGPGLSGGPFGVYLGGNSNYGDAPGLIRGSFTKEVSTCDDWAIFNPFVLIIDIVLLWFVIKLWHRLIMGKKSSVLPIPSPPRLLS